MKELSANILDELTNMVNEMIINAKELNNIPSEQLNTAPAPGKWNALECFEHINLYSNFYVPELEYRITHSKHPNEEFHKSGWLGKYSYDSMLPKEGKKFKTMNTFKQMNPTFVGTNNHGINQFIKQQEHVLLLIEKSRNVSLRKTKCKTTLKIVWFNLGDTLRFYVYHNMRHIQQAQRAAELT